MKNKYFRCSVYAVLFSLLAGVSSNKVHAQNIYTIAGNGILGYSGDGGPATAAELYNPTDVKLDPSGNAYIADYRNNRVRMVNGAGIITTFAGNGIGGYSGDGGPATAAEIYNPIGIATDGIGNVYIGDYINNRIRMVNTSGIINTIGGNGIGGYSGDGGPATAAEIYEPFSVAVDGTGNVYIADYGNDRIRMINTSGVITTIAGTGTAGYSGDGGPATAAEISNPVWVGADGAGDVYIADYANFRIRMVNTSGIITTVAGNGIGGYSGDGGAATAAEINYSYGVATDNSGNVYIGDYSNNRIRIVDNSGVINTYAGNGTAGYSGDGGLATAAEIKTPVGVTSVSGNVFFADYGNNVIRVAEAPLAATIDSVMNVVCNGGNDGSASVARTGGMPAYTYLWTPGGQTSTTITGLSAGTYTVTITDVLSDTAVDSVTITQPAPLLVTLNATKDSACVSSTKDSLMGSPAGGTFSGTGVTGNNFNPSVAGIGTHTITYTYTDSIGCTGMDSIKIIVGSCTGINEISSLDSKVQFYPNPFNEDINVTIGINGPVNVTMYNALGEKVGAWQMGQGQRVINAQSMPAGVYMMQVKTSEGTLNRKLIKVY